MTSLTSLWFSLPCLLFGSGSVWLVYQIKFQMRRSFHNPSYQLGMVMATAVIALGAAILSIFGKIILL